MLWWGSALEPKKGDFSISGKSEAMIGLHDSLLKANGESFKLNEFNYDTVCFVESSAR